MLGESHRDMQKKCVELGCLVIPCGVTLQVCHKKCTEGKILYGELLKSWSTLGRFLANSPSHGNLQGTSLQWASGYTRYPYDNKPLRRVLGGVLKSASQKVLRRCLAIVD